MNRDPFYIQIIERLSGQLDPEIFEQCATDLLRSIYPGLTPMRGGSDSGMDGAIGDNEGEPFPLISTTGEDVIGNLTRNIEKYKKDGGKRRNAVLATSQNLTARRKRNLHARATKLGFTLSNIHDQAAFADLLYHNSKWCLELLNLPSTPPSLSKIPKTERPFLNAPLIGREASLEWLSQTPKDRLLLGQPGSGKTFLLHKLSQEGKGLFLNSREPSEIAAGIRDQMPTAIFVDDAARDRDLLITLRQMREEMGISFDIIASGWPGEKDDLMQALNLVTVQVHELEQLTRPEIIEVIHHASTGWVLSDRLMKELVDQAEGQPGLAVTLTLLCLRGGVRDVVLGDFLSTSVLNFSKRFVDEKSGYILAVLSLSNDRGMTLDTLSQVLSMQILDVHRMVNQLSASGVILQIWGNQLIVRPPKLRYALIRDIFFTRVPLPIEPILAKVSNRHDEVTESLIGAQRHGANIPDQLLHELIGGCEMPDVWKNYAWLGRNEAEWAFVQYPSALREIAMPGLAHAPDLYLPALLTACIEDKRPLHSHPDHFLRLLEDWIKSPNPETSEGVENRRTLLAVLEKWFASDGTWSVGGQALRYVMSPHFKNSSTDPGIGRIVSMRYGVLSLDNLNKIKMFWPRILSLLDNVEIDDWSLLQKLVEDWAYPGRLGKVIPKEIYEEMRSFGEKMLHDVVLLAAEHPGVIHWAKVIAENCGYDLQIEIDDDFQTLYPFESRDGDLEGQFEKWNAALPHLVNKWIVENPETVAKHLAHIEHEARIAKITWPRLTPAFCSELAKETPTGLSWVKAFQSANLSGDLIHPFLQKSMEINEKDWDAFFAENIDEPSLQGSIIPLILTSSNPPQELLDLVLQKLDNKSVQWVRLVCMRQAIPEKHMPFLLKHGNIAIAFAAAEGEWSAKPEGVVRASLRKDWEAVIVQYHPSDLYDDNTFWWLSKILVAESELSYRWLENLLAGKDHYHSSFILRDPIKAALTNLTLKARLKILEQVPNEDGFDTLILDLVNRSPDIYKHLLALPHLKDYHLVPLSGDLNDVWIELATLALNAGYSPDDIAAATVREYPDTLINMDGEADKWSKWIKEFERIASQDNELFKRIGEAGKIIAKKHFDDNERRLRHDSIYGWD